MLKCLGCEERYVEKVTLCPRCSGKDFIVVGDPIATREPLLDGQRLAGLSFLLDGLLGAAIDRRVGVAHLILGVGLLMGSDRHRNHAIALQWVLLIAAAVLGVTHYWLLGIFVGLHAAVVLALLSEDRSDRLRFYGRLGLAGYWLLVVGGIVFWLVLQNR